MRNGIATSFGAILLLLTFAAGALPQSGALRTAALRSDTFTLGQGTSLTASPSISNPATFAGMNPQARTLLVDIDEALQIIESNHFSGRLSLDDAVKGAIDGMLSALDPHSSYLLAGEFKELLSDQSGEYFGIGTTIANHLLSGRLETFIIGVQPGSPAASAGLRFGDMIVSVDGNPTSGLGTSKVRDLVRGASGSTVRLTVRSYGSDTDLSLTLRRTRVSQPSIPDHFMIRPGVGFVSMTEGFEETTSGELRAAINQLKRDGMTALILDLRGNPGGLVSQAVKASEIFLPYGKVIVTQRGRHGYDNAVYRSGNQRPETMPVTILVDRMTASAAEIFAGALQDHDRALIIGETTFGKGLVQSVVDLPTGRGLTLTTARYYTPSGRSIQRDYSGIGIYDYFSGSGRYARPVSAVFGEAKSARGRLLPAGDGIQPEINIVTTDPENAVASARSSLFFFAKTLIDASKDSVAFAPRNHDWYDIRLPSSLLSEFLNSSTNPLPGTSSLSPEEGRLLEMNLRYLLATADIGPVRAQRVFIEQDPVILRALDELATAKTFALTFPGYNKDH